MVSEQVEGQVGPEARDELQVDVDAVVGERTGSGVYASMVGAAIGFGLGMVFALGGFWAGLLCLIFTVVGAIIGRLLWTSSGGSYA